MSKMINPRKLDSTEDCLACPACRGSLNAYDSYCCPICQGTGFIQVTDTEEMFSPQAVYEFSIEHL